MGRRDLASFGLDQEEMDRSLGFVLHDVARLLRRAIDRRAKEWGVTRTQWWVLGHLLRTDGQTQTDLAIELDMEKASLGRLLDRLEESGWIERRPDPDDRRAKRVFSTAKVDPILEVMSGAAYELYEEALDSLDAKQREALIEMLVTMRGNLLKNEN